MSKLKVDPALGAQFIFLTQKTKQRLLRETAKKRAPAWEKKKRAEIRAIVTRHYQATLDAVQVTLSQQGAPAVSVQSEKKGSATVSRRISFKDGNGKRRRLTVGPWKALSLQYAARPRVSTVFWNKTGRLEKLFNKAATKRSATVRASKGGGIVKQTKDKFTIRSIAKIGVQRLTYPYGKMISDAFIQGRSTRTFKPGKSADRFSDSRILFPEADRPFISKLSAKMGQIMHTSLRKLP